MLSPNQVPRALLFGLAGIGLCVVILLAVGVGTATEAGKSNYEIVRDLFVPLIGPLVAVLIPIILFFVIPLGQGRQRLALDLCSQYFGEEMRDARNTGWRHFVTEQRQLPEDRRAERLNHFLDYLTDPNIHRTVDPQTDAIYQKATRVLDFFAVVNGCLARSVADRAILRDFLLFYYVWWRNEILEPLRQTKRLTLESGKVRPVWWEPLTHLDALAAARTG